MRERWVVVLGGTGFLGRCVIAQLAAAGYAVRVPTRRLAHAEALSVLPRIELCETKRFDAESLAPLFAGADAVISLIGILNETRPGDFERIHVGVPKSLVEAARRASVRRVLHVSALNASLDGPSEYLRSKAGGERVLRDSKLDWTIIQPSVIFGPGDRFLNRFASLLRWLPVIPLAGANARFQPVYVGDVANVLVRALDDARTIDQSYALCGPKVYTLRELLRYTGELAGHRRAIIGLGASLAAVQAAVMELLPGKLLTRDNLRSMEKDSVCDCAFPPVFALQPTALESIAPLYLGENGLRDRFLAAREKRRG